MFIIKMNTCNNNLNMSYTTAKALHKPSGYSLLTSCSFDKSENKQTYYRKRDCMKRFCNDLKEHVIRINNYEAKPMIALTEGEKKSYEINSYVIYAIKNFVPIVINKSEKLGIVVIIQGNIEALHIVSVIKTIK